ncbi:MAG: VOC family protein [Geminicoccaceae bacterium]
MAHGIAGIDHVILGVRDLEQARATYEHLGFRATPRGRHVGWGTANYCLMFPSDYVEILGIVDSSKFTNDLDRFLEEREGLARLALRSTDPVATHAAWHEAGLEPADIVDLARLLEPDIELRFKNVMLEREALGNLPLFACAHLTPEPMRRREWLEHPNGALGIGSVTVVADDPNALAAPLAQVFGPSSLTETDDTLAVHTGDSVLLLATPDDLDMLHPQIDALVTDRLPALVALTLRVADPDRTAAFLEHRKVEHRRGADGAVGIDPEHTHGVMLEFVAAARQPQSLADLLR